MASATKKGGSGNVPAPAKKIWTSFAPTGSAYGRPATANPSGAYTPDIPAPAAAPAEPAPTPAPVAPFLTPEQIAAFHGLELDIQGQIGQLDLGLNQATTQEPLDQAKIEEQRQRTSEAATDAMIARGLFSSGIKNRELQDVDAAALSRSNALTTALGNLKAKHALITGQLGDKLKNIKDQAIAAAAANAQGVDPALPSGSTTPTASLGGLPGVGNAPSANTTVPQTPEVMPTNAGLGGPKTSMRPTPKTGKTTATKGKGRAHLPKAKKGY